MSDFTMTIGGDAVATEGTFGVRNPATAEVFAQAPECSRAQLDAAMDTAAKAFPAWRADIEVRRQALRDIAAALLASLGDLAPLLTAEQGKPLNDANLEIFGSSMWCSYFAELDTTGPKGRQVIPCRPSDALALVLRQRMPTPVLVADWVFDDDDDEPEPDAVAAPVDAAPVDDVVPDPVGEPDPSVVVDNVAEATDDTTDGS